ncbi:MAG: hypothetical protein H5U02_00405 [Clostridia bacterium]|nr:hypothetical protein [Clostridia bacterium]
MKIEKRSENGRRICAACRKAVAMPGRRVCAGCWNFILELRARNMAESARRIGALERRRINTDVVR